MISFGSVPHASRTLGKGSANKVMWRPVSKIEWCLPNFSEGGKYGLQEIPSVRIQRQVWDERGRMQNCFRRGSGAGSSEEGSVGVALSVVKCGLSAVSTSS